MGVYPSRLKEATVSRELTMPTNAAGQLLAKVLLIGNSTDVLLGEDTKKGALLIRFANKESWATPHTIGIDFKIRVIELDGRAVKMQVWDTAGQERFRAITSGYYRGAHGLMFVFDAADRRSFDDLGNWLHSAEQHGRSGTPRLLVGDVSACGVSTDEAGPGLPRVVSREEAMAFATDLGMKSCLVTATPVDVSKGDGVDEAFFTLARDAVRRFVEGLPPTRHLYGGGLGMLPASPAALVHLCVAHLVAHHVESDRVNVLEAKLLQLPAELQERVRAHLNRSRDERSGSSSRA